MAGTRFHIVTLGCKVNQYESQSLREAWQDRGWQETPFAGEAGVVVVNSCAVTQKAVADVRAHIRRLHREAPQARILVTGCAAATVGDSLAALPGVHRIVDKNHKASLLQLAAEGDLVADLADNRPPSGRTVYPPFAIRGYERSRAVLKIQEGCSHRCTYCIVPLARGGARSRPLEESLAEAGRLLRAGFGEIVISGINLRQYGTKNHTFWHFVSALESRFAPEWAGRARFRISSLEPGQLDDHALETLARSRLIAPHLHLSLQSGSPRVLEGMGRGHYAPEAIADWLEALRGIWPLFGLGADLISGFPGETEADHALTEALAEALPLTYAHVFPYSRRPGTPAALMPQQVADSQKKDRAARLRAVAARKKAAFAQTQAALPRLLVALEKEQEDSPVDRQTDNKRTGVSEFYGDCVFTPDSLLPDAFSPNAHPAQSRNSGRASPASRAATLVPARPAGVLKGRILVQALPGPQEQP